MPVIIPIASGKGGVGKSLTAVNLSITLSQLGKAVILVDSDLGGSNAHTFLGIKNRNPGIGSIIHRQEKHLEDLILSTRFNRLYLIPGDGQLSGTANPPVWVKRRIEKEIPKLVCDYVILDLGAGVSTYILDMFLLSKRGLLVTTPEIPALLNGYNFIKHAAIRIFQQHTKNRTPEGKYAASLNSRSFDYSSGIGMDGSIEQVKAHNPEAAMAIKKDLQDFYPQIVLNMGTHQKDLSLGANISKTCLQHLGIHADFLGFIPWYANIRKLINTQKSIFEDSSAVAIQRAYRRLGESIITHEKSGMNRISPLSHEEMVEGLLNNESDEEDGYVYGEDEDEDEDEGI